MKTLQQLISGKINQRGATTIIVALVMVVLIGITALAVDIGYIMVRGNELQNIADGAALAATRKLGTIYQELETYEEQQGYEVTASVLEVIAQDVAANNNAGGTVSLEVTIGDWNTTTKTLTETLIQPDAVMVRAAREGDSSVATFFASIFGIDSVPVWKDATAALTGQSTAGKGDLEIPVGISIDFFDPEGDFCKEYIKFYPTSGDESCAGWTTFEFSPSNDPTIQDIITGELENDKVTAGETKFEFTGGTLSRPTFEELLILFQEHRDSCDSKDGLEGEKVCATPSEATPLWACPSNVDSCGVDVDCSVYGNRATYTNHEGEIIERNEHMWDTTVVVYDQECGTNPNQEILIVGFAKIRVTDVQAPPSTNCIEGTVLCNYVEDGETGTRGGGGKFGTKGSIPGLVE
jgi:hypothetical protein